MEEEEDLSPFLDAQQEVAPSLPVAGGGSGSSDRSSRGCTPPLSSLSWPSRKKSGKSKSRPESPAVNRNKESPSSRSLSKFSDGGSSSKSRKSKKKLSTGSNVVSPDTSFDLSQGNSSCAFSASPSNGQSPAPPSISKVSNYPSTSSFTSYGSDRKKKKSWMSNALSPTYRQRCDDLRKNFPGIPSNEVLVGDYSCALQKDILVHGRVYVTTNYLCFYANIFRWETAVIVPWKEVEMTLLLLGSFIFEL